MGMPFLLGTDYLRKIQSVRPENLVSLWPQSEPLGHAVSEEIVRGYDGAYTAVTLGGVGVPGSGLTSAGSDGATSYNNIYTAGFANDNLITNPGFETAGALPPVWANWTEVIGTGALANEVVIVHEGTDAAKLTAGATADTRIWQPAIAVVPGVRYRLRFWTRGDGVNAGLRYEVFDETNGLYIIPSKTDSGVSAAAWTMVAHEFTAPAGCLTIFPRFWCSPINTGVCYLDATEIRRMDGFLGDQGTVIVPAQVSGAGVWTDAAERGVIHVGVDANNYVRIYKTTTNNTLRFRRQAAGVVEFFDHVAAPTDFVTYGITWDEENDIANYYVDGALVGTDAGLLTWVGDIGAALAVIGAISTVPASVWSGNLAPAAYWSDALTPDEMRYLG